MEYKTTYTKEEIDELDNWFKTHEYEQELDMGHGIYIANVNETVPPMMHTAKTQHENKVFSGQIQLLFKIRQALIDQNKVKGEK